MIVTALAGFLAGAAAAAADPAGATGATRAPARAAVGAAILGAVALVLGEALPGDRSALAAGGTGAALVLLGLWAVHVALQLHAHGHDDEDAHDRHHGHDHPHDHDHHDHPHGAHDQAHHHHAHAHGHHAHLHTPGAGPAGLRRALAMAPALVLSPRTEAIGWAIGAVIALLFATAVLARLAARVEAEGGSRAASLRVLCGTMGVLSVAAGCLRILSR